MLSNSLLTIAKKAHCIKILVNISQFVQRGLMMLSAWPGHSRMRIFYGGTGSKWQTWTEDKLSQEQDRYVSSNLSVITFSPSS